MVRRSQWFEMTPLPDDVWEFGVKIENQHLLADIITDSATSAPLRGADMLARVIDTIVSLHADDDGDLILSAEFVREAKRILECVRGCP